MIFLSAMILGMVAGQLRSVTGVVVVALMIGLAYAAAITVSLGPVSILPLLLAIAGYNSGLIGHVTALLALERRRPA